MLSVSLLAFPSMAATAMANGKAQTRRIGDATVALEMGVERLPNRSAGERICYRVSDTFAPNVTF
jgi:hypothetical protein